MRTSASEPYRKSGFPIRFTSGVARLAILVVAAAAHPSAEAAQSSTLVHGVVRAPSGEPIQGARIAVDGVEAAITGPDGRFRVTLEPGTRTLVVDHPAYRRLVHSLTIAERPVDLDLQLRRVVSVEESVTVVGIRAGQDVPVTTRNIDREELEGLTYGQDVPALLQYTPSMTWYSDSGAGSNYSYFSLRGIQQTRINMTFDGAPLNDPAEHALYFNNFHDFTSAVDSVQIQRGVGTSSVGTPAYGGSVNFASRPPAPQPGGRARLVLGSYDTAGGSVAYESGIFDNGLFVSGRFSYTNTEGYRERSGSEHDTVFLNAGWQGERSQLKFVGFSGRERSQLAYLAVDPDTLAENRRFNPLTEEDRDRFGQRFAQVQYTSTVGDASLLTASAYYNGADGWFQLWDDPVAQQDLLRFGIDQGFYGGMVTLSTGNDRLAATVGLHANDFSGDHFLDSAADGRLYRNTGHKQTVNAFGKVEYDLGSTLLFGDLQLRWAGFTYDGDIDLGSVDWTFLDPKVGVRRILAPGLSLYGSAGRAQREPARLDLLLGEDNATIRHDLEAVMPESVVDVEAGINYNTPRVALQANAYFMEFRDEIALTGELSEIGLPLRRNVDRSYRRGVEVDLRWMPLPRWTLLHSLNLSRNRIREWTQFYDVFNRSGDWVGSDPITYRGVPHLLTPSVLLNLGVEYAHRDTSVMLMGRSVSHAQLDNTGLEAFQTPSYANIDLLASQGLGRWWPRSEPRLRLFINNLLNSTDQYPSGYSYQFINRDGAGRDTLDGIPFYYPLATFNATVALEFGF
jgi:iron complex outermembrane receptor protein